MSVISGGSTLSTSNLKEECPECKNELTIKYLFNHLRTKHPDYLYDYCRTTDAERALKLTWEFRFENEGEEDHIEYKNIYACLGSNKTFQTEERAIRHFKKNKDAHKEHTKLMKKLLADIQKKKKKQSTYPINKKIETAKRKRDPNLGRAVWRAILFNKSICDKYSLYFKDMHPEEAISWWKKVGDTFQRDGMVYYPDAIKRYEEKVDRMNALLEKRCLDYNTLLELNNFFHMFWNIIIYRDSSNTFYSDLDKIKIVGTDDYYGYAHEDMPGVQF